MSEALAAAVGAAVGVEVASAERARGGDINQAARLTLADGRRLFVKFRAGAPAGMYRAEANGLAWLASAGALPVPQVVAVGEDAEPRFLALGWIEPGAPAADHGERLGHGLATLHRAGAEGFGGDADNFIGNLEQANGPRPSWAEFYAERRLAPLARRAIDDGALPAGAWASLERLFARLPDLVGPEEPPARLHGDLWAGNAMAGADGRAYLVDPAAYGGHREVDLAMMRLFGGFSASCFAAYDEAWPLAPGHEDRVALYQLYPLLVHAVLFGGTYGGSVLRALRAYSG